MRRDNIKNNDDEYINIDVPNTSNNTENQTRRRSRISDNKKTKTKNKREKKPKKKWSKKKKIIVLSIILLIIISLGVVFGVYVYKADGDIAQAVLNVANDVLGTDDPIFVLVLGVSEDISSELTDTIILGGYNPKTQQAFMLSIPRDTFVGKNPDTAGGYDKINALYQTNVKKTVSAVEKITGVKIDNYVLVKNTVLPSLVDAVGGEVEFDVPINMNYDDATQNLHIHLKKGLQKIDRNEAEQLLRFRHNTDGSSYPSEYGDNDYGRMKTQREFIKAVAKQLIKVNNVGQIKTAAEFIFANLETDMPFAKAVSYIPSALKFNIENIVMEQLPGSGAMLNNLSFFRANASETKKLMDKLINGLGLEEKEIAKHYTGKIQINSTPASSTNKHTNTTNTVSQDTTSEQTSSDKNTNQVENQNVHNHSYTILVSETPASCTKEGSRVYKCSCGEQKTEKIPKTAHTFNGGPKCTVCGAENPDYKDQNDNTNTGTTTPTTPTEPTPGPGSETETKPDPNPNPDPSPEPTPGTGSETDQGTSQGDTVTP